MADSHSGVPVKKKFGDRKTDDLTPSKDYSPFACDLIISGFQQFDYAGWGAGYDAGVVGAFLPEGGGVERMEPIDIFFF